MHRHDKIIKINIFSGRAKFDTMFCRNLSTVIRSVTLISIKLGSVSAPASTPTSRWERS